MKQQHYKQSKKPTKMGQRQMSYIITEDRYNATEIHAVYNQWNHIKLQTIKLHRAIKFFKSAKDTVYDIFDTWFAIYGLSPEVGWVGGFEVTDTWYKQERCRPFEEDNNNGWLIIKLISDEKGKFAFEICNIAGSEDGGDYNEHTPVETREYLMMECPDNDFKDEYIKMVDYICENTVYNPALKEEAVSKLIGLTTPKKVKA